MDPHVYSNTSGLYGAMAYPLVDDWEMVENALLKASAGSYVLYRSTEARQQEQDINYKDTIHCFEVHSILFDSSHTFLTLEFGSLYVSRTMGIITQCLINWCTSA
jgi:hypothetical protein